jgi:ubiquinone biosynthesis protein
MAGAKRSILNPIGLPNINRTYKNIRRMRQILTVFGKHGFSQLIETVGLSKLVPFVKKSEEPSALRHSIAERLCLAFEELGPTFVKLGQMFASRPDLVTPGFAKAFHRLRDDVRPVPIDQIRAVVEEELEDSLPSLFPQFEDVPLGAASIAQVHGAKTADDADVVVKVQRPGISKIIDTDLSILNLLAQLVEKYLPEARLYNPIGIVEEFTRVIRSATDFIEEAHNIDTIHRNFTDNPDVVIPDIFWELSSKRVLTMERINGIPLHNVERLKAENYDLKKICDVGVRAFLEQVFIHGVFHADLHGGNIFVLPDNKIALVDFGEVGRIGSHAQTAIASIFVSLLSKDFQALAREYVDLGTPLAAVDLVTFADDLEKLLGPLFGRKLKDVDLGVVLSKAAAIASQHHIRLPRDLVLVGRVIVTMEDLIRQLDPEFDLLTYGGGFAADIVRKKLRPDRLAKDLLMNLRDLSELSKTLPAQIKYVAKKISNNELAIRLDVDHFLRGIKVIDLASKRMAFSIVIMGLIIGSSILSFSQRDTELFGVSLGLLGYAIAGVLGIGLLISLWRSGKD